jgi:hypothetical protein
MEFLLSAFSDEMRFCCMMFPKQVALSSVPLTANVPTTPSLLNNIIPKYVWSGDIQCQKIYASDMLALLANTSPTISGYYWSLVNNVLNVYPAGSSVRVVGDLYPKSDYTTANLNMSIVTEAAGSGALTIPGLTGGELNIVRYRSAQRLAEFLGDFNRAQYFLQASVRKEADIRSTAYERSTTSLGSVLGSDM